MCKTYIGTFFVPHNREFFRTEFEYTVKLGYNDHSYNEFTAITNKIYRYFGPILLLYYISFHGYNDVTVIANKY